ncbi:FAD/NAD(P)-binding domain-containing protein [Dendrothele bispora CBS 962.96]|uniref:FAD/NAD(P)-binding domain-containing protein n=1 Tax=Dendrothele bispora (strain CBS 962.96) TaxID=1314807 RepID=A0A4S8LJK5_DENBC|nr:FAD/NAD(P)-binding domain-containing protein [Dendrothele bispora CBS 962.96]
MAGIKELKFAIIGSGMAGLSTALSLATNGFKNIAVYEMAVDLGFFGAGIQIAPNMARLLDRLGVWRDIEAEAVELTESSIRQGSTDHELAHVNTSTIRDTYGYPHMVGHRASLVSALYNRCRQESSISFHFSSTISRVLSWGPKPKIEVEDAFGKSHEHEVDVVLACDGIKSVVRAEMLDTLKVTAEVEDTGQAAYRIMLTRDKLQHDPELLQLVDGQCATRWVGDGRLIVAYPISDNNIYNIVTIQPDTHFSEAPSAAYTTRGSKVQMLRVFSDFCPRARRLLQTVSDDTVCEWKLRVHSALPTWTHEQIALVGDACHPTLPHLGQGAAQAMEDACVLGFVLSMMPDTSPHTIGKFLKVYENLRRERTHRLAGLAFAAGQSLLLGEGQEKDERDKIFAASKDGRKVGPFPDRWADADIQKMIYGFDCLTDAYHKYQDILNALD